MKQLNLYWLGGGGGSSVPDGRTVTPVNDVTLLQQCAGIANPTYTSLSQILADTGILQTILSNQNAVNYLVRSTGFAKSEIIVPKMTSNNTPSGQCITAHERSGNEAYMAFDRDANTFWSGYAGENNQYVGYIFPSVRKIRKVVITFKQSPTSEVPQSTWKIQVGDSWTDVETFTLSATSVVKEITITKEINVETNKIRIFTPDVPYLASNYNTRIGDIEIYEVEEGFCDSEDAMRYIGLNNYAANTLLDDSNWHDPICDSAYFERVLNVKVPKMTSATTPSGKVIFNGTTYEGQPYYSFNSDLAVWKPYGTSCSYKLGYVYPEAIKIHKVVAPVESVGKLREVEASNDETNWTEIANYNGQVGGGTLNIFGASQYSGFRVFTENTSSTGYLGFYKWQFYGRKDV